MMDVSSPKSQSTESFDWKALLVDSPEHPLHELSTTSIPAHGDAIAPDTHSQIRSIHGSSEKEKGKMPENDSKSSL